MNVPASAPTLSRSLVDDLACAQVVVDETYWVEHLPDVIEAVAFPLGRWEAQTKAQEVWNAFNAEYRGRRRVPLISYDLSFPAQPFQVVSL